MEKKDKKNIKLLYETCMLVVKNILKEEKEKGIPTEVLDSLKESFEEIILFIKRNLLRVSDSFYGNILYLMESEIKFNQRGPIDINIKVDPCIISFNPLFCSNYSYQELLGVLIGELLKLVYEHPAAFSSVNKEKDKKKHEFLEKSSSASVSGMIQNDIRLYNNSGTSSNSKGIKLPEDAFSVASLFEETKIRAKEKQNLLYYYKILSLFDEKNNKENEGKDSGKSTENGSFSLSLGEGESSGPSSSKDQGSDSKKPATKNNSDGEGTHDWENTDEDDTKEKIKGIISDALSAMNEKERGFMPANLLEQINRLFAPPEIDWENYLKKMVGAFPVPYRKTRTRLNRRQPYRADLCGRLPKRRVEIIVAIDTSGSMSNSVISFCLNEIFNIVKDFHTKITIVECDAQINKVYEVKKTTDVQTKVGGRGGTSFIPVINFINGKEEYRKKFKESGNFKKAIMIYFTDGFGDSEIPKPLTYRNLWVVMEDKKNLSLKDPFGEVKSLKDDKKFLKWKNSI